MRNRHRILFTLLWILSPNLAFSGQNQPCVNADKYEKESGLCIGLKPLVVNRVLGKAIRDDSNGIDWPNDEMRGACLSLFTADSHAFVSITTVDQNGRFDFGRIPPGKYRLVARAPGFETGNIAVEVARFVWHRHRQIKLNFAIPQIDSCTGADYDRK